MNLIWKIYKGKKINMMIFLKTLKVVRDHPLKQVIGDPIESVRTIRALGKTCEFVAYISQMEPKNYEVGSTLCKKN